MCILNVLYTLLILTENIQLGNSKAICETLWVPVVTVIHDDIDETENLAMV